METIVSARRCQIPDGLRERAEVLLEKVARAAHRPQRAEVLFQEDHQRKVVELRLILPRGQTKISSGEASNFRTALDRAVSKLRNQLEKPERRPGRTAKAQ